MVQAIKNISLPNDEKGEASEAEDTNDLSVDKISEKLPEIVSAVKLFGNGGSSGGGSKRSNDRRIGLLLALRPYLSPHRCEIIDYIIKMNNIGEIFKNIM